MRKTPTGLSVVAIAVAVVLSTAGVASATPLNWSPPTTLSSGFADARDAQVVTGGGTITTIWTAIDGFFERVQTSSSTDGGATWSQPVTLSTSYSNSQQSEAEPQLVTDGDTITAVWRIGRETENAGSQVASAFSTDRGVTWSYPEIISAGDAFAYQPQLVTDGDTVTAIWTGNGEDENDQVRSAHLIGNGGWSEPETLSSDIESGFDPQLVTDGTTVTAIWTGPNDQIQTSSSTNNADWTDPETLSLHSEVGSDPQLVTHGATVTAIWTGQDNQIQTQSSTNNADWTDPETLSLDGEFGFDPQLVSDGSTITAMWSGDSQGVLQNIQTATFTAVDGWIEPVVISNEGEIAYDPQLAANGTTVIAVWTAQGQEMDKIQTSSLSPGDQGWSTPDVISHEGESASTPQLATDGTFITAIWSNSGDNDNQIHTRSSNDDGDTWGDTFIVSDVGGFGDGPQLVTDGTTITAIWTAFSDDRQGVQTSSSTDGGDNWSPPDFISNEEEFAYQPQLVTDGTTITAIWAVFTDDRQGIQTSSSTDGGDNWSPPDFISDADEAAFVPQLVTDGTTITAIWTAFVGGDVAEIKTSSFSGSDERWSEPDVISNEGETAYYPQLVTDGTTLTSVWTVFDEQGAAEIHTSSFSAGDDSWSTPVAVSNVGGSAFDPQLVTDGDTITAVWSAFGDNYSRIQTSSSDNAGDSWSEPDFISVEGEDAYDPQVATGGDTVTAIWIDGNGQVQTSSSIGGGTWSEPDFMSVEGESAYNPQVVTGGGTITTIWGSVDDGNSRIQTSSSTNGGNTWSSPLTLSIDTFSDFGGAFIDGTQQVVTDGTTITAIWSNLSTLRIQTSSSTAASAPGPQVAAPGPKVAAPGPQLAATGASDYFGVSVLAGGLLLGGCVVMGFSAWHRRTFASD